MPVFRLSEEVRFPRPELAEPDGLLAIGGDLSPERLVEAYAAGIFPWYSEGEPILWWSLDPRWLLDPAQLHVPRSLQRTLRRGSYRLTADSAFRRVIERCAVAPRPGQDGTWVTHEMVDAYCRLHELGLAHSVEAWEGEELAGGLYGVSLGAAFFGESMFADAPDASKTCLVGLCRRLQAWDFDFIDCQMHTEHLERFGASPVPRAEFLERLGDSLDKPTRQGRWTLDDEGKRMRRVKPWEKRGTREVADCRVFSVRADRAVHPISGHEREYFVIESSDWVNVIALTTDERVVLIEQFRHGIGEPALEIPGGMIDPGEDPLAAGLRELREETGYGGGEGRIIGVVHPNPALQNNRAYSVLVEGVELLGEPELDAGEDIAVDLAPLAEVPALIAAGRISHALVVAAFHHLGLDGRRRPA